MPDFDYTIIDGDSTERKIRGEDLGTDGGGIQIIGHKFRSDEIGAVADAAAADETGSSTMIALLKGALRELIAIAAGSGGGASSVEGTVSGQVITTSETTLTTIDCRGRSRLGITVENVGAQALNSFVTKVRYHNTFSFYFPEVTGSYDANSSNNTGNATLLVIKTNGTAPENLAVNGYTWIRFNVEAIESIEFTATVASGSSALAAWWILE